MARTSFEAVIFDLGGVVFPSPFEAFDEYGRRAGLPDGFVRDLIRTSSETGAWAALERGELDAAGFREALAAEAAAAGHHVDADELLRVVGEGMGPRPEMIEAIEAIRSEGLRTAALTNNWPRAESEVVGDADPLAHLDGLFDVVVESSVEGVRKPDPRIYRIVLDRLGVPAERCAYLDDLGINLKPARAMGMTTIKVVDSAAALEELQAVVGVRWT